MTTFYPTEEEFARGPLPYIESITAKAVATGIAHVVPPASWNPPPLALRTGVDGIDEGSFRFGVRVQPTSKLCRRRPDADFGFALGSRSYSLGEFSARCRAYDAAYFGAGVDPSVEEVEEAFWGIVDSGVGDVCAEYGSDLDNVENGSGFPMPDGLRRVLFEKKCVQKRHVRGVEDGRPLVGGSGMRAWADAYRGHPWNVNNFSLHPRSALSYLVDGGGDDGGVGDGGVGDGGGDDGGEDVALVSGVMVPWVYVGSTFAAFNWHVEDHALYSVNYLHEGAPKIWYCVPSAQSDGFEVAMRDALPALFEAAPDLLRRLVTQLCPRELRARGVEVYRVVHTPGSFIVTMPNVYHSGLNTGFNVAESCNFGALPWLPYSKGIAAKYAEVGLSRPVSISHDMMLVRMIERCREPDMVVAAKRELRIRVAELSVWWDAVGRSARCVWQQPATEEADCVLCDGDLWLFGCYEEGRAEEMVCLRHAVSLGGGNGRAVTISYRYTIEELISLSR